MESKGSRTFLRVTCQTIHGPKCRAMGPRPRHGIFTHVAFTTIRCVSDGEQEKCNDIARAVDEPKYCHLSTYVVVLLPAMGFTDVYGGYSGKRHLSKVKVVGCNSNSKRREFVG